ncbi:CPBP family intramembrane glutamic endopeptidase [Nocardia spumae]|uniref:CPBP family intramembrane glutamic endopeptidase n=1 Tax=Nocardia spumae TaxID=2887190 RepID=UPI001D14B287|nr:type II CAAX endopeptidase family protein [Nocardia spumae]
MPTDLSRRPLTFLVAVTLLSLPLYLAGAFGEIRVGALRLPLSALMFVVPGTVAVVLTWRGGGRTAAWRLVRRVRDSPPAQARWYVTSVGLFVVVAALAYAFARAVGAAGSGLPVSPVAIPVLAVAFAIASIGEELGWTAYATDPLQDRIGTPAAGLILGFYWALWHLLPLTQVGHGVMWVAGWFAGTVATRVIIVWLHNRGGGVGVAVLAHTTVNVTAACTPDYDAAVIPLVAALPLAAIAAAVSSARRRDPAVAVAVSGVE